jgi:hypothetical protein
LGNKNQNLEVGFWSLVPMSFPSPNVLQPPLNSLPLSGRIPIAKLQKKSLNPIGIRVGVKGKRWG